MGGDNTAEGGSIPRLQGWRGEPGGGAGGSRLQFGPSWVPTQGVESAWGNRRAGKARVWKRFGAPVAGAVVVPGLRTAAPVLEPTEMKVWAGTGLNKERQRARAISAFLCCRQPCPRREAVVKLCRLRKGARDWESIGGLMRCPRGESNRRLHGYRGSSPKKAESGGQGCDYVLESRAAAAPHAFPTGFQQLIAGAIQFDVTSNKGDVFPALAGARAFMGVPCLH